MSAISPAWSVIKNGIPYTTEDNDCKLIYRTNHPSEAFMKFDNSDQSLSTVFSEEDEVQVKIGSTLMMMGYVDKITDIWNPNKKINLLLHIVNWGDYRAAKTVFEKEYKKNTSVEDVFIDAAANISGLTSAVSPFPSSSQKIKRDFAGTYVKDVWDAAAEVGGGDFFCDENKLFYAHPIGLVPLVESTTHLTYKIQSATPTLANQIQPLFNKQIKFIRDVSNFFRKVTVTNGIVETYPSNIDLFTTQKILHPTNGKEFSAFIGFFGLISLYSGAGVIPHKFLPATDVGGGFVMPTVQALIPSTSSAARLTLQGLSFDGVGNLTQQLFNIDPLDWKQLRFFIRNQLTGSTITSIKLKLQTGAGGTSWWEREIYDDIKDQSGSRTNWVYLQYDLPDPTNPGATGWTVHNNPTKFDKAVIEFTPLTGYNVNSYVELGKFYLFRRQRSSQSSPNISGNPLTEKIIVNNTAKNKTILQNLADNEFARVSQKPNKQPDFTIEGNVNFKRPGNVIDIDLEGLFGTLRKFNNNARMDEIHHYLNDGIHYTDIFIDSSFNRK